MWYFPDHPGDSRKCAINSSEIYPFLPKFWNLPEMNEENSYMFYTFFKNLQEMEEKPH